MRWYGWILVGGAVALIGLLLAYLPGYAPSGVSYSMPTWTAGIATAVVGALVAARGLVELPR